MLNGLTAVGDILILARLPSLAIVKTNYLIRIARTKAPFHPKRIEEKRQPFEIHKEFFKKSNPHG